jgi:hypothetical protein
LKESEYRDLAQKGEWPFLPNPCPLTQQLIPCINPSYFTIVSGASSSGKTSYMKYWMLQYVEFAIRTQRKLKVVWVGLEEDVETFRYSIKSYLLGKQGYDLSEADLKCVSYINGVRRILTNAEVLAAEKIESEVEEYMSYFHLLMGRGFKNPTGIHKELRRIAFYLGDKELTSKEVNDGGNWDRCIRDDWDILCVIDHVGLLTKETGLNTKKERIEKMVSEYINMNVTKHYRFTTFILQQQAKYSKSLEYGKAGEIYPSDLGLSDDKDTMNDCRLFVGITAPFMFSQVGVMWDKRYERRDFEYPLFRVLNIPKNTYGKTLDIPPDMIPMRFYPKQLKFEKC